MSGKRCTEYSIASGTVEVVRAVLNDTKLLTPVSTYMDGSAYGVSGIYESLPCVIGAGGVERVVVPEMSEAEVAKWHESSRRIADNVRQVAWLAALCEKIEA